MRYFMLKYIIYNTYIYSLSALFLSSFLKSYINYMYNIFGFIIIYTYIIQCH